ncbi:uncharacterized protein ACRADG_007150 [Cochliomyia hominivorax]
MMSSSTQIKLSKEKQNLQNFTTPKHSQANSSERQDSSPDSPIRTIDFDDFTSSSSIMEFLKQEQKCGGPGELSNGHDSEIDADSIFQEVSRLADNSDTRSVDELLREAELLLQHHHFIDSFATTQKKKNSSKPNTFALKTQTQSTIQMNSKYTKSIENVKPRSMPNKLINGYITPGNHKDPPKKSYTPETPTPTNPLSSNSNNTFNAFVDNLPSESVISEESVPIDLQANTTASVKSSSSSNNTTGKDITTKQMDGDDTDDGTDTIEEITEAMETIELIVHDNDEDDDNCDVVDGEGNVDDDNDENNVYNKEMKNKCSNEMLTLAFATNDSINLTNSTYSSLSSIISTRTNLVQTQQQQQQQHNQHELTAVGRRPSYDVTTYTSNTSSIAQSQQQQHIDQKQTVSSPNLLASPLLRLATNLPPERCSSGSYLGRRSSMTTPDSGVSSQTYNTTASNFTPTHSSTAPRSNSPVKSVKSIGIGTISRSYCDKSVNSSPVHVVSTLTSPIDTHNSLISVTREHALKQEIEQLQERLKDTEERLESFRIQHDTVSQLHRKLRENNTQLQEESEMLKLDVQHLNECANVLRTELQAARHDRDEALDLQKVLQNELEETRAEKKRAQEQKERDAKTIQDLQRQCREMERILMRKHPDSVSALIVASKSVGGSHNDQENHSSRKLLEQRIAQLESDAKEQDLKAQQILANVQARFNSVQAKYETHIADLETQVLSLQEINTKLNEKIESQVRTLDYFVSKKAERFYNNCTQTEESYLAPIPIHMPAPAPIVVAAETKSTRTTHNRKTISTQTVSATRESGTNTIGTSSQHSASSSTSSTANSTPNNSRPNSKQSGIRKPMVTASSLTSAVASKLPISQSDSTISMSASHAAASAKEDAHLLATIRGMRVDLAIKNKALQRLTRELDECKKTIRKIQKEKEAFKCERSQHNTAASSNSSKYNVEHMPASTESQALKEAQNKYKLLEADYKSLHEKRLQDLKTLQTAHERELATCHETVRILQQRLNERDEQFALQKRRKVPVDYYALKAKVSSLERRHTEREERLHMLVEALSKGRLNGALDDLLADNNNQ